MPPPPNGLPPNGGMDGIPGVMPPGLDDEELDPLPDERLLPPLLRVEPTLIFEYIALNAVWTAAELLPLMSTTRTVRFAARASSSIAWTSPSIWRKSDSLEEMINVFVRASTLSVSLMVRACC